MSWKRRRKPAPGWNAHIRAAFQNARVPSVPATLDLQLAEYFAGAGAMGVLSAQLEEPDVNWVKQWSFDFGEAMAAEALRRRKLAERHARSRSLKRQK